MNKLLKELHQSIIADFSRSPLTVKNYSCQVYIHFSEKDEEDWDKKTKKYFSKKTAWVNVVLPQIPRIGEEISFNFLQESDKFTHGYVHNVWHIIDGVNQEIHIDVHPTATYYYRWQELKEEHDDRERWLRSRQYFHK